MGQTELRHFLDGANAADRLFRITLPLIKNIIGITWVLSLSGTLGLSYILVKIMTGGGPGVRSAYLGVYMYKTAFVNSDFGTGSAITVTIVLLSLVITVLFNTISAWREKR